MADQICFSCEHCGALLSASAAVRKDATISCRVCGASTRVPEDTGTLSATRTFAPAAAAQPRPRGKGQNAPRGPYRGRSWLVGLGVGGTAVVAVVWLALGSAGAKRAAPQAPENRALLVPITSPNSPQRVEPPSASAPADPPPPTFRFRDGEHLPLTGTPFPATYVQRCAIVRVQEGFQPTIMCGPQLLNFSQTTSQGHAVLALVGPSAVQLVDIASWTASNVVPISLPLEGGATGPAQVSVYDASIRADAKVAAVAGGLTAPRPPSAGDGLGATNRSQLLERGHVLFLNVETGAPAREPLVFEAPVRRVLYSPNGKYLVVTASSFQPPLYVEEGRTKLRELPVVHVFESMTLRELYPALPHAGVVDIVQFSADGETLLTAGPAQGKVKLWRVRTGEPAADPIDVGAGISAAAFFDAGQIAVASYDGSVTLWDGTAPQQLAAVVQVDPERGGAAAAGQVTQLALTPRGDRLATADVGGAIRLWRIPQCEPVREPILHGRSATAVAFSPNGQLLLTAGLDGKAQLWTADAGIPVGPPLNHLGTCHMARFSGDGRLILSCDAGGLRLWRVPAP